MSEAIGDHNAVLFQELPAGGAPRLGHARLNAEKSLNAFGLDMIRLLGPKLRAWADDPRIACVILDGAGSRAFCAGGDVRSVRSAILAHRGPGPNPGAQALFGEEYRLDYHIHTYPKPILVWGSGIVMGGGLGLLVGASHRVVTETSRIAMPEINIGLYPDVGASWFLRRMPYRSGLFMALTAASLNGLDALATGLADHFLNSADHAALLQRLAETPWRGDAVEDHALLSELLHGFAERAVAALPPSNVLRHVDTIERCTEGRSLAAILGRIAAYAGADPWLAKAAAVPAAGSPTTAALIWALWQRAHHMSLADVFRMELIVSVQCCKYPDCAEGVRAVLVDKDNRPRWTPATLAEVTREWVQGHFESPWPKDAHPLADL